MVKRMKSSTITGRRGKMATNIREIAADDQLIIEGKLQGEIWDSLIVQCGGSQGVRCSLVCPRPCRLAKRYINEFLPAFFRYYARWN